MAAPPYRVQAGPLTPALFVEAIPHGLVASFFGIPNRPAATSRSLAPLMVTVDSAQVALALAFRSSISVVGASIVPAPSWFVRNEANREVWPIRQLRNQRVENWW